MKIGEVWVRIHDQVRWKIVSLEFNGTSKVYCDDVVWIERLVDYYECGWVPKTSFLKEFQKDYNENR